ncbi:MAG: lipocalin family protein [Thermonemataceae bacterium]
MRQFSLILISFILLGLTACDNDTPGVDRSLLVGTWTGVEAIIEEEGEPTQTDTEEIATAVIVFEEDGTFIGSEIDDNGDLEEQDRGAWALTNNLLVVTIIDDDEPLNSTSEIRELSESSLTIYLEAEEESSGVEEESSIFKYTVKYRKTQP